MVAALWVYPGHGRAGSLGGADRRAADFVQVVVAGGFLGVDGVVVLWGVSGCVCDVVGWAAGSAKRTCLVGMGWGACILGLLCGGCLGFVVGAAAVVLAVC